VNRIRRITILFILVVLAVAVPATAMANKQIYKASISTTNEIHTVVGSVARGSAAFNHNLDGSIYFQLIVRNLSGDVTSAHIHGPASESENAGAVVTLCGAPAPAVAGSCITTSDGTLEIRGTIMGHHVQGTTAREFISWFTTNLTYVNVHTALNPAGEARGQIYRQ
jgi:hypothetical protein